MKHLIALMCLSILLCGCASAGKPLISAKAQLAEQMNLKLAEQLNGIRNDFNGKVSAIEKAMVNFTTKADAQLAGIAGVNNSITKTATEFKARDVGQYNDTSLLKDYIKYLSWVCGALILTNFITLLFSIIEHIIIIVYLLKSDRLNDASRNKEIMQKEAPDA